MLIFTYYLITQNATLRQHCHAAKHMQDKKGKARQDIAIHKAEKEKA